MDVALAGSIAANFTIQILTHNLWCHYLTHAPNKEHRIRHFVQNIAAENYDVVLIQELFIFNVLGYYVGQDLQRYVIDEMKKVGYAYSVSGAPPPFGFGQTSGLLILSKHPIITENERRWYRLDDFKTGKGFIHAVISIQDVDIHFFNVHLDAHHSEVRLMQLKELVKAIPNEDPAHPVPVVIAGDYNVMAWTNEYDRMMGIIKLKDIYNKSDNITTTTHTRDDEIIDHVLVAPQIQVLEKQVMQYHDDKMNYVSDHMGIRTTLRITA